VGPSDYEALPALAAKLVARGVVAIAATRDVASARAAQRAEVSMGRDLLVGVALLAMLLMSVFPQIVTWLPASLR
jgi:hypothetical protein